ncbi:hypothetical protein FB107DRAFT_169629, partial [Schizophyllum commune]
PLSQTYGTPSDQLRRAEHHHRGSTFSFRDGWPLSLRDDRLKSSDAHRHSTPEDDLLSSFSGDPLSSSGSPLSPSGASLPESTYHISSIDRRWQAVLQDTIRRLIRSLGMRSARAPSKRAFQDIVRQAMKLCKLDLVRKRSVWGARCASSAEEDYSATGNSSTAGDSGATMLEGPTAGENAMERSAPSFLPSFLPSYPRRNTHADPHDWLASEGGSHDEPAGGVAGDARDFGEPAGDARDVRDFGEDYGGLDGAKGALDVRKALSTMSGDALNFDDPSGFEVHAGGSVNDPSSLNDDDNASTISLLDGEPLS